MTLKIGFIGLGTMGYVMARRLMTAGYPVKVWNRSIEPLEELAQQGAIAVHTAVEAATDVDVLISMLANDEAVSYVINESLTKELAKKSAIHVNMATISVELAKVQSALHKKNQAGYLAAPVLGRVDVAETGQLNILAAGDKQQLNKVQPLLNVLGQKTWYFGEEPAQANVVKIASNFLIMCVIESLGESFSLVENYGMKSEDFLAMLTHTLFSAPVYKNYGAIISNKAFSPAGFKLTLGLKDTRLALSAAEAVQLPLPFANIIKDNYLDSLAKGDGQLDWSALAKVAMSKGTKAS